MGQRIVQGVGTCVRHLPPCKNTGRLAAVYQVVGGSSALPRLTRDELESLRRQIDAALAAPVADVKVVKTFK